MSLRDIDVSVGYNHLDYVDDSGGLGLWKIRSMVEFREKLERERWKLLRENLNIRLLGVWLQEFQPFPSVGRVLYIY